MANVEVCENCERTIGKLERPFVWNDAIVCAECYARLTRSPGMASVEGTQPTEREMAKSSENESLEEIARTPYPHPVRKPSSRTASEQMICPNPNCGFRGLPRIVRRGSYALGVVLCLVGGLGGAIAFGLVGLLLASFGPIYILFIVHKDHVCPQCSTRLRSEYF